MAKSNCGRKDLFALHFHVIVHQRDSEENRAGAQGTWRQTLKKSSERNAAYWLAPHSLLSFLFYTTWPGLALLTLGQGLPSILINQEHTPQICIQAYL